jgi:hypothetical protein
MLISRREQPLPLALPAQRDELARRQLAPILGELSYAAERVARIEDEAPFHVDADFECGPPSTGLVAEVQSLGCGLPNTHLVPRVEAGAEIPGRRAGQRTGGSIVTDQNANEQMPTQVGSMHFAAGSSRGNCIPKNRSLIEAARRDFRTMVRSRVNRRARRRTERRMRIPTADQRR